MRGKQNDKEFTQHMKELIERRIATGVDVRSFCEENGITYHQYYYWYRKLRSEISGAQPEPVAKNDTAGSTIVEVTNDVVSVPLSTDEAPFQKVVVSGNISIPLTCSEINVNGMVSQASIVNALMAIREVMHYADS